MNRRILDLTVGAARWLAVSAFLCAALFIVPVIKAERLSAVREAEVAATMGTAPPLPWERSSRNDACGTDCPSRARAAIGVLKAIEAARAVSPDARLRDSHEAEVWLEGALTAQPSAGEWWAWLAYSRLLHGDGFEPFEYDIAASYQHSPFMAHLAAWRIKACAYYWPRLRPDLQAHVEDELVWLRDIDPDGERATLGKVVDPAAQEAFRNALRRPPAPSVPHRSGGSPGDVGLASGQRL